MDISSCYSKRKRFSRSKPPVSNLFHQSANNHASSAHKSHRIQNNMPHYETIDCQFPQRSPVSARGDHKMFAVPEADSLLDVTITQSISAISEVSTPTNIDEVTPWTISIRTPKFKKRRPRPIPKPRGYKNSFIETKWEVLRKKLMDAISKVCFTNLGSDAMRKKKRVRALTNNATAAVTGSLIVNCSDSVQLQQKSPSVLMLNGTSNGWSPTTHEWSKSKCVNSATDREVSFSKAIRSFTEEIQRVLKYKGRSKSLGSGLRLQARKLLTLLSPYEKTLHIPFHIRKLHVLRNDLKIIARSKNGILPNETLTHIRPLLQGLLCRLTLFLYPKTTVLKLDVRQRLQAFIEYSSMLCKDLVDCFCSLSEDEVFRNLVRKRLAVLLALISIGNNHDLLAQFQLQNQQMKAMLSLILETSKVLENESSICRCTQQISTLANVLLNMNSTKMVGVDCHTAGTAPPASVGKLEKYMRPCSKKNGHKVQNGGSLSLPVHASPAPATVNESSYVFNEAQAEIDQYEDLENSQEFLRQILVTVKTILNQLPTYSKADLTDLQHYITEFLIINKRARFNMSARLLKKMIWLQKCCVRQDIRCLNEELFVPIVVGLRDFENNILKEAQQKIVAMPTSLPPALNNESWRPTSFSEDNSGSGNTTDSTPRSEDDFSVTLDSVIMDLHVSLNDGNGNGNGTNNASSHCGGHGNNNAACGSLLNGQDVLLTDTFRRDLQELLNHFEQLDREVTGNTFLSSIENRLHRLAVKLKSRLQSKSRDDLKNILLPSLIRDLVRLKHKVLDTKTLMDGSNAIIRKILTNQMTEKYIAVKGVKVVYYSVRVPNVAFIRELFGTTEATKDQRIKRIERHCSCEIRLADWWLPKTGNKNGGLKESEIPIKNTKHRPVLLMEIFYHNTWRACSGHLGCMRMLDETFGSLKTRCLTEQAEIVLYVPLDIL